MTSSELNVQRLERLLGRIDEAWWEWNISQDVHCFSTRWWSMLGYHANEFSADAGLWLRLAHPEDVGQVQRMLAEALEPAMTHAPIDIRLLHKDGQYIPLLCHYIIERDGAGKACYMSGISIDQRAGRQADILRQQAAAVLAATNNGVMITDADGRITLVNQAFSDISGYAASEAVGSLSTMLQSGRHDAAFYAAMWDRVAHDGQWQGEIWNRRKTGEIYPELLSIRAVKNHDGLTCNYVGVFSDISRSKASEAERHFLVHYDPLTKLPNRLLFLSLIDQSIKKARRENVRHALLILDLDRLKDLNDSYGHAVGDELLQQVADRLRLRFRDMDIVARLGGDEFALMLENVSHPESIASIANEIIVMLSRPWILSRKMEVHVGVSIGISLFPDHGANVSDLLQQADSALHQAKNEGRGCFRYFSESLTQAARERINLASRLHHAIDQDELRVYYQPQVDIASGRIIGAEALVRWQDQLEGLMSPLRFIPIAEESGLINDIGAWVMMQTCLQGRRWIDAGLPELILAVNISPKQFLHGDVEKMVAAALSESGFPAASLELELTESALMDHEGDALAILHRLRALGVRIAIDDFGTGYSSLSYLKRFPLDVLKIDKSFVDSLPHRQDDRAITSAIVAMGHALGFKVLAEGVENVEQLAFLQAQGCDIFQGYLCSRPVPAEIFAPLLHDRIWTAPRPV